MDFSVAYSLAEEADLTRILDLFEESIRLSCNRDYDSQQIEAWVASRQDEKGWLDKINTQYFLLAEVGAELAGFASLQDGYLDFLYVHPRHQGRGVATGLYQRIEARARQCGQVLLQADVSITARPFFEKQGFEVLKVNQNYIRGVGVINYRMRKVMRS